ncbi:hypothetical protein Acr_20g0010580 [Actinidia rufa]|uniref:MADS-box domain-containing protein n=1 Tax=Actinidia rufa TaxID=165716 RepID=A0A7J0GEK9_9ERIC|nr:hypothetical protein Acr_20g0010580 [Actinidia rufa]
MTRNKITHSLITNESARKATLKKRGASFFKKTDELSVLSDVTIGTVVYSPGEADPTVYPSYEVVKLMFEEFMSMSILGRSQKMVTQESFQVQRVIKEIEEKNKEKKRNDRLETQEVMNKVFEGNDLNELDIIGLNNLALLTVDKLKELKEKATLVRAETRDEYVMSSESSSIQQWMNDQWFMETTAFHQDFPGPSGVSEMGSAFEYVASTSTEENEELQEDLDILFPRIYSP